MPATTKSLFLQISGNSDGLTKAAKAARVSLADIGTASSDLQRTMQENFAKLGGESVQASARTLEASYRRVFANIRSAAEQDLGKPISAGSVVSTNVRGAQQSLTAAEASATAYRTLANAQLQIVQTSAAASAGERQLAVTLEGAALAAEETAAARRTELTTLRALQSQLGVTADAEDELGHSHTRMGASGLIAQHVVRSFADSVAAGQSPVRAFATEVPRAAEALQFLAMESGNTKGALGKFAGFMGGPWGIAITAGVALLTPLVGKLFEAHDAAQLAKLGNDGLSEAQGSLGKMFDLTSGKLEHQNEMLRVNARLTAANLRTQAMNAEISSRKTLGEAGTPSLMVRALNTLSLDTSDGRGGLGSETRDRGERNARVLGRIGNQVLSGKLSGEDAVKLAAGTDYRGVSVSKEDFLKAIGDAASVAQLRKNADLIDQTLDSGKLATGLRNPDRRKPPKPKVDHTAEREADADRAYQSELGAAQDGYAKAQLALSDTAEGRLKVEIDELRAAKVQRDLEIDDQVKAKKISGSQADKLKSIAADTEQLQEQLAIRKEQSALLEQSFTADQHERDARDALLSIDLEMATTREERLKVEKQLLADQQAARRAALQKTLSDPLATKADKAQATVDLGRLPAQEAAESRSLDHRYQDPLAAYQERLKQNVGSASDALAGLKVDGLEQVEDAFSGIVSGSETVKGAIKKMVSSMLADFARLAAEKAILSLFGGSIFGGGGGANLGSGYSLPFADGGLIRGPGGPREDKILARLSAGEFVMNAAAVRRHLPLLHAMNDNSLPAFADGGFVGSNLGNLRMRDISNDDAAAVSGRGGATLHQHFDLRGAVVTEKLYEDMQSIAQQNAYAAFQGSMAAVPGKTIQQLSRAQLPGSRG